MDAIFKSIDNRDIAVLFWLLILLGGIGLKSELRKSLNHVWRAFTRPKILFAMGLSATATALSCYWLNLLGLWSVGQLKGSVVWFLVACIPSMLDIPKLSDDFSLFKKAALKNFELSVLAGFYLNLFKATLLVELIVIPVVGVLTCMLVLSEKREELKRVHGLIMKILATVAICWLVFQTYKLFASFHEVQNLNTVRDVVLPIAMNLAFLPFMVLFAAYAAYESIFVRIKFVVKDPKIRAFTKFALVSRCGLNYMRANRWFRSAWHVELNSRSSVWRSIGKA